MSCTVNTTTLRIASDVMRKAPLPYQLKDAYGITLPQATAIYDAGVRSLGMGGKGDVWLQQQIEKILTSKPTRKNSKRSARSVAPSLADLTNEALKRNHENVVREYEINARKALAHYVFTREPEVQQICNEYGGQREISSRQAFAIHEAGYSARGVGGLGEVWLQQQVTKILKAKNPKIQQMYKNPKRSSLYVAPYKESPKLWAAFVFVRSGSYPVENAKSRWYKSKAAADKAVDKMNAIEYNKYVSRSASADRVANFLASPSAAVRKNPGSKGTAPVLRPGEVVWRGSIPSYAWRGKGSHGDKGWVVISDPTLLKPKQWFRGSLARNDDFDAYLAVRRHVLTYDVGIELMVGSASAKSVLELRPCTVSELAYVNSRLRNSQGGQGKPVATCTFSYEPQGTKTPAAPLPRSVKRHHGRDVDQAAVRKNPSIPRAAIKYGHFYIQYGTGKNVGVKVVISAARAKRDGGVIGEYLRGTHDSFLPEYPVLRPEYQSVLSEAQALALLDGTPYAGVIPVGETHRIEKNPRKPAPWMSGGTKAKPEPKLYAAFHWQATAFYPPKNAVYGKWFKTEAAAQKYADKLNNTPGEDSTHVVRSAYAKEVKK